MVEADDQGRAEPAFAGELVAGQVAAQLGESHAEAVPVFQVVVVVGLRARGVVVEVVTSGAEITSTAAISLSAWASGMRNPPR